MLQWLWLHNMAAVSRILVIASLLGLVLLWAPCHAQTSANCSRVEGKPVALKLSEGFRKAARKTVKNYQKALDSRASKSKRDDAQHEAAMLMDHLNIDAESVGDKPAYGALQKLTVLVKASRMEELLYSLGPAGTGNARWREAHQQAEHCAARLDRIFRKGKYIPVTSCQTLPRMWQPRCGDRVPHELTQAGWVVPCKQVEP